MKLQSLDETSLYLSPNVWNTRYLRTRKISPVTVTCHSSEATSLPNVMQGADLTQKTRLCGMILLGVCS